MPALRIASLTGVPPILPTHQQMPGSRCLALSRLIQQNNLVIFYLSNNSLPSNLTISENIELIAAACRKFRYDCTFVTRLKPVQGIGRNNVLLAWTQYYLMPDSIRVLASFGSLCGRKWSGLSFNVKVDGAPATTKSFLFAGIFADRWMTVLWACLMWEQYKLLGADSVSVDIHHQL